MPEASTQEPPVHIDPSDPHKGAQVREMFAGIADRYDALNRVLSVGRDQSWRRKAVKMAKLKGGERILDCCCGTGDLTLAFWAAKPQPSFVVGGDFTPEMLHIARRKTLSVGGPDMPPYTAADALHLPFRNAEFDVVSVAFGLRNVQDVNAGLRELVRTLRPGGRLVILEFTPVKRGLWRALTNFYVNKIVPRIGQLVSRSRHQAYKYLPESIGVFPDASALAARMEAAGLNNVHFRKLNFGTVAIHVGTRE
ncbi:MAG: bifunctional demethylmenaquinone methyltransferase/2-methoxy-6-polyprenyl-1,4-benzoquinol methylase UbiE [Planctomycetes bacterium]|nr:bifunctional demethylmenaquinone methyltransferase/2-methoxy-6-polyprenyl-1,4-benzoquinol methylase UbiE [Planctomycetota bacterium]